MKNERKSLGRRDAPVLRDDEELEALEASSSPFNYALKRIRLKKRVAVCVDNRGVMRAASMA